MKDEISGFPLWWECGYGPELLPIIPPNAKIAPKSSVREGGKTPGRLTPNGWVGLVGWTEKALSEKGVLHYQKMGASVGIQTRKFHAIDIDVEDEGIAAKIERMAVAHFGDAPVRYRAGSARRLMLYRIGGGETPLRKRKIDFAAKGTEHAVELLGAGNQCVVEGKHKSDAELKWRNVHPCQRRPEGLTPITKAQADAFQAELTGWLETMGYPLVKSQLGKSTQTRSPLDKPSLHAPSPQHVLDLLKVWKNDLATHDEFVRAVAAIKAALGPDREDYYSEVEEWALQYEGNDADYVRTRWDSIKDSSLGWGWLTAEARAAGYDADVQEDFGEPVPPEYMPTPEKPPAAPQQPALSFRPFTPRDVANIPCREWVYGRQYIRRFLSATIAPGGVGKSKLAIVEALAMATGRNLLGSLIDKPVRVAYINLEDPFDEIERQIAAACQHYSIKPEEYAGRLFVISGREQKITIAVDDRGTFKIAVPIVDAVKAQIEAHNIDVLIIDPFVASHAVSENDNNKINAVCDVWRALAEECNCAVELIHHTRKFATGQREASVDDGRGASALLAAVRSARVINPMTDDEAQRAGVENRRSHIRVDNGKANLAPPAEGSTWYQLISVQLGNGHPIPHAGDSVGVVVEWKWPDPAKDVTPEKKEAALAAIVAGEWRESSQADNWVGYAIAAALGLDLGDKKAPNKSERAKVKALQRQWTKEGVLTVVQKKDGARIARPFVEVAKNVAA